ncbi:MAG: hypothetical protein U9N19_04175 [Thermodesulfobacteriota bacterium]|nr:hypothetical protein [Thermodesulfobacteriota bacterium]
MSTRTSKLALVDTAHPRGIIRRRSRRMAMGGVAPAVIRREAPDHAAISGGRQTRYGLCRSLNRWHRHALT